MPTISSDARFFGIDLQTVGQDVRKALQGLHQWPLLAWLTPAVPVRLLQADGSHSLWCDGAELKQPERQTVQPRCVALELPEAIVLRRQLTLPPMAAQDIANAVALDAQSASPFGLGEVAWGYSLKAPAKGAVVVEVALASRRQIQQYIHTQADRLRNAGDPEVWVLSTQGAAPLVFAGFGEAQRSRQAARWRHLGYALLGTSMLLLAAIAITPTAQLRLRAIEAVQAYEGIVGRAAPAVREREELLQSIEQLSSLAEVLAGRIEPLTLMDRLTQALPDDTALQTVKLQGGKVTILGLTGDASSLMRILGEQPGLRDVRAPSAATRMPGAQKESFMIEFMLDPAHFGVQTTPSPVAPSPSESKPSTSTPTASVDAPGTAHSSAAPLAAANPSASAAAPASPPAARAATFGGGATFGGVTTRPAPPKEAAATTPAAAPTAPAKP